MPKISQWSKELKGSTSIEKNVVVFFHNKIKYLTLSLLVTSFVVCLNNLYKQFGPRLGPTDGRITIWFQII